MSNNEKSEEFRRTLHESARLLSQNRPGEALAKLAPLHKKAPTDPDVAINLGGAYILQRKWDRAVEVLNQAAEAHPSNAMLWTNLAAALLGNLETAGPQQQARAIEAYERALQADSETPNVHYHLGLIYKERGELNRATAFFQRALEVHPGDKDARSWLDQLSKLIAKEKRASEEQTAASTTDPDNSAVKREDSEQSDPDNGENA
jgi:tetratricopeptide (TPR) repeat protein